MRRYLERALADDRAVPRQVRVAQEGRMRQKPGGRELAFTAAERFAVDRVAFSWRARFPVLGPLALHVVDEYADGDGTLEVRLLGLPVQRQRARETVIGEALRYVAELPWAPHALSYNEELEWRALDDRSVEAAVEAGGERLAVRFELDEAGDIVRTSSESRLIRLEGTWVRRPWGADVGDYAVLAGTRIPTRAEVYWDLERGRFVYWRGRVTSAELLDEPFERR
jgi:hypothetical protein